MTKAVLVRPDGTCGASGLALIEESAADNKTQGTIASMLGIPRKKFDAMLNRSKGDNPERLCWERGHARLEQKVADTMLAAAMGDVVDEVVLGADGAPIIDEATGKPKVERVRVQSKIAATLMIYFSKARLGWQEKPTGALIQDNRIQITLPAPSTKEEMFRRLGIQGPLDFRKEKPQPVALRDITEQVKMLAKPEEKKP